MLRLVYIAAVAVVASTLGCSPNRPTNSEWSQVRPERAPTTPEPGGRLLSAREWAHANYPNLTNQRYIKKETLRQVYEGYQVYLSVHELAVDERMRAAQLDLDRRAMDLAEARFEATRPNVP